MVLKTVGEAKSPLLAIMHNLKHLLMSAIPGFDPAEIRVLIVAKHPAINFELERAVRMDPGFAQAERVGYFSLLPAASSEAGFAIQWDGLRLALTNEAQLTRMQVDAAATMIGDLTQMISRLQHLKLELVKGLK
jgi:hypothetical protein